MKVVVATGNKGKIREIKEILGDSVEVLSAKEAGCVSDPEENGSTFLENAFIKADALFQELIQKAEYAENPQLQKELVVLADDSGLCVEALNGGPGVHTARYAGEDATDAQKMDKLLVALRELGLADVPEKRSAKFVCAAVAVCGDGRRLFRIGEVAGRIAEAPIGDGGFGYDPVFFHEGYGKGFGQLSQEEKNAVSHRGQAFRALAEVLLADRAPMCNLNIVLVEPEIPQNTGNIVRTCAATGAKLHLVRPLGFSVEDKYLKRAGLDYWSEAEIHYYDSFEEVKQRHPEGHFYYASTKAVNTYADVAYPENTFIVFGKETKGLPEQLLFENKADCIRIPMRQSIRSLNLANSVNIILYEVYRQYDFAGLCEEGQLTQFEWEE